MKEFRITSGNEKFDAMLWLIGADHYFLYNPFAEALRIMADYIETKYNRYIPLAPKE